METLSQMFEHGGVAMYAIAAGSILALALGIERGLAFRSFRRRREALWPQLMALEDRQGAGAIEFCRTRAADGLVEHGLRELVGRWRDGKALAPAAERLRRRWVSGLRRGLWLQGTLGATMPFIGLYGTVVGVLGAFDDIRSAGTSGFAVVAGSISEALITTAGGIAVAVEAVVLFNIASAWAGRIAFEAGLELEELVERLEGASAEPGGPDGP